MDRIWDFSHNDNSHFWEGYTNKAFTTISLSVKLLYELNLNGSNELEYMKWKNALSFKLVCFSLDWLIDDKNENQSHVFIGLARIWSLERIWILLANFPSCNHINFSNLQPDFQSQRLLLANFPNLQPDFQSQKLLANFLKMKSDFQRQELLLANFSKMKYDFQRQGLLLANFPKMKSDFQKLMYAIYEGS